MNEKQIAVESAELLVAAKVLEIAADRRKEAWLQWAVQNRVPQAVEAQAREAWKAEHPLQEFVPEVMRFMHDIALQMRDIKTHSNKP